MKIPYGVRDFEKLITEGYFYFDRTDRIPLIESLGSDLLFLRPRRFGKTLWLSTLMNYYDVAKAADFTRVFGKLAIGQNPTPLHNQYLVMKWDFSTVQSHGTLAQIEQALNQHVNQRVRKFVDDYAARFPELAAEVVIHPENGLVSFHSVVAAAGRSPYKLYLFIDEYDNFANEVMMGQQGDNHQRYLDLVKGEGMFKTFFKNIKSAGSGDGLDRVFITGVSPVVMNDVTSGNNVTESIYWLPAVNDLCGFREEEVADLLAQIAHERGLSPTQQTEIMALMRLFYDGSWFTVEEEAPGSGAQRTRLYNPTLVFYFLKHLSLYGRYPRNMLDGNLAPDYYKLVYISGYPTGRTLIQEALQDDAGLSIADVGDRFGVREILQADKQHDHLASLLCYLGALTVAGQTPTGQWRLEIPNLVMRRLYADCLHELIFPQPADRDQAQVAADALFAQGAMAPLCDFVENHYFPIYDNRDYKDFNELTLKTLFLCLLHYNPLYIMDSEPALQRTYADLIMLLRPEMRHFSVHDLLLEFKYVPLSAIQIEPPPGKTTPKRKPKATGAQVRQLSRQALLAVDAVQTEIAAAKEQLRTYQQVLQQKYGAVLKLRTYAVVSIGVERLVWEEVTA